MYFIYLSATVSTSIQAEVLAVSLAWAFRCVPRRNDISIEEIAYPISLGRFIRSFPHNLEFIILMSEKLFTSGKHLRQLLIFSVDAPAYSPQGQSVQNSKNLRATFQTLQASVNVVNIKVHNITVRKRPKTYD